MSQQFQADSSYPGPWCDNQARRVIHQEISAQRLAFHHVIHQAFEHVGQLAALVQLRNRTGTVRAILDPQPAPRPSPHTVNLATSWTIEVCVMPRHRFTQAILLLTPL